MGTTGSLSIFKAKWEKQFDSPMKPVYMLYQSMVIAPDRGRAKELIYKHYGPYGITFIDLKMVGEVTDDADPEYQKEGFFLTNNCS